MAKVRLFRSRSVSPAAGSPGLRWGAAIAERPWTVLAVVVALTLLAAFFATRLVIDSSAERLVQQSDPAARYYAEVRDLFGREEVDAVIVFTDDATRPETLEKVARLDARISAVPGVERVQSVASIETVRAGADGSLEYGKLMPTIPQTPEEASALRSRVDGNPLMGGTLLSRDGKAATLIVRYRTMPEHEFVRSGTVERVKEILAAESGPEELHLIGSPSLGVASAHLLRHDIMLFTPLSTLVLAAVLFVSFRSVRGVLVPLATVGIGLVWLVGLMGFLDVPLDVIGLVLPSLLLAIGNAYSTHVVASYYDEATRGGSRKDIVARVLGHVGPPVVITAFTTLTGFAALAVYRVPAIRSFGALAAFGIATLFVLSLTFTAALLAVLPLPRSKSATTDREWPWLRRVLDRFVAFDERRRVPLLCVAGILVVALALGIPRIEFDTDIPRYFPKDSPERRAAEVSGEHLGGNVNFLIAIDGVEAGAITRLDLLRRVEALQQFLRATPGISETSSIADVLAVANRALNDDDPAALKLPESDEAIQQILLLVPPEATEPFLLPDGSRAVIRVRSSHQNTRGLVELIGRIEERVKELFPRDVEVRTTGATPLVYQTADDLAAGQVASVLIALAVIFATMSVYFVSIRLGLVAMLPNLVPIVLYFGFLGWFGIPLSISTAVIASVALGLGVDEAIHLLSEFNRRVRAHGDQQRAIHEAMATVGPPVVFTTLALTLGNLVQAVSGFVPIQQFAYFSALNVVTSLLADLLLMPALVSTVRFVTIWDLVALKLGHAPEDTIPLFNGLTRSQARIAILMGQIRTVACGERFVTQGAPANEMFVLLSGRAEVRVNGREGPVTLNCHGPGAVIGEMGLLRNQARSADVVALEATEVLRVDERFFDVLRRRYPRIASVVLKNLSRTLSDRLQVMTERMLGAAAAERQAS